MLGLELLAAYTVGLAFGFGGAMELGRRARRAKTMDTDKITRFLNGFLAAAQGVPSEGDWSSECKDGWTWFHDLRNQSYADATNRSVH